MARQREKITERKLLVSGEVRALDTIDNNTPQPVRSNTIESVKKRSLFEVNLIREKEVRDPYHRGIVLLFLVTSRMRGKLRRGEAILDKWKDRYPGAKLPGFYKSSRAPDYCLVDDLLIEVVNWFPAVVIVSRSYRNIEGDSSEESEYVPSDFYVPYRYRISKWFSSLEESIAACRPGDAILIDTDITINSTVACQGKPIKLISKSGAKKPVISSWSSGQYPLLSLGEGCSFEASNISFRSNNMVIQSVDCDNVSLTNCDIVGGLLHGGVKNKTECGSWKLHKVSISSEKAKTISCYGLYLAAKAVVTITHSVISSHATAVRVCGGELSMSDTRITGNGTGGGVVIGRASSADLKRVDFSNNAAASVQVYSTSLTTSICDSSFAGEYPCCRLLSDLGFIPGHSFYENPCQVVLSRNELRASALAPCLQLPSNMSHTRIIAEQNVFYSEERAIVNRMTLPSTIELHDNTFEQPASVAILTTSPGTALSISNRFTLRE